MDARRDFDGEEGNVAGARRFVAEVLRSWDVPEGDAVLLVSELATNAVLHAASRFSVVVTLSTAGVLRVEVADTDPTPPVPDAAVTSGSVRGRGLLLVTSLAKQWGYHMTRSGKTVWFEV